MKKSAVVAGALALALLVGTRSAEATVTKYAATITGAQVVPPVTTTGSAVADLSFDDGNNMLTGTVTITVDTAVNSVEIDQQACGVNGGIAHRFDAPVAGKTTISRQFDIASKQGLEAGNFYFNIETAAHPNGELRGQIYAVGSGKTCGGAASGTDAGASSSGGTSSGGTSTSSGAAGTSSGAAGTSSGGATSGGAAGSADAGSGGGSSSDSGCSTTPASERGSGGRSAAFLALSVAAFVALARRRRR